jgi:anti-anti-sigma regulatory factor
VDVLNRREPGAVVIDIPGVLDTDDRAPALDALCAALDQCQEPLLVVRLSDSIVTSTALHVLSDAHGHAATLGITLRVEAKPPSVHVFRIVGLTHLLESP